MPGSFKIFGEVITNNTSHLYLLHRGATQRYLFLNSTLNGYVVHTEEPEFTPTHRIRREVIALSYGTSTVYVSLNSTGTGLRFSTTYPTWAVEGSQHAYPQMNEPLFRGGVPRWIVANSTLNGIRISSEPYPV